MNRPDSQHDANMQQKFGLSQAQPYMQPMKPTRGRLGFRSMLTIITALVVMLAVAITGTVLFVNRAAYGMNPATRVQTQPGQYPTVVPEGGMVKKIPTVSPSAHWVTVQTFADKGTRKTSIFSVPDNWRIVWSCNIASHNNRSYNVIIHANTANNVLLYNSVEATCSKNNTHSITELHEGGKVYLSIISEGNWTVQVQKV